MIREPFNFSELLPLKEQIARMPRLEPWQARDDATLSFRRYSARGSGTHVILIHGSASHSGTMHCFAQALCDLGQVNVYTPDLRGHGPAPVRRGDIDYIGQLDDDLADFIQHLRQISPACARIVVGGHSSGGGLALRFASGPQGAAVHGVVLMAPYLGRNAPAANKDAGGWVTPSILRIVPLLLLNRLGIMRFNSARVLRFNLPERFRTGFETLEYSFRLMRGMHPDDFRASLARCPAPLLVLIGGTDEVVRAQGFAAAITALNARAAVESISGCSHLGIIMSQAAVAKTSDWLRALR